MKTKIFMMMVALGLAPAPQAFAKAGGTDGGGGSVIQCQVKPEVTMTMSPDGKPVYGLTFDQKSADSVALSHGRKYELTDLWEAENGYGPFEGAKLTVNYDNTTSVDQQITDAVGRLQKANPKFAKLVQKYLGIVRTHILPIHQDDYVLLPQDTDIRYLKRGCDLDGLGYYSDKENNLVIDPDIRKELSHTDEAAFFMHEAIYKILRDKKKEKDSWDSRRMVGYLFSQGTFTWTDLWKK